MGLLLVVAFVAGCGAPRFRYVKNGETRSYLKVPRAWTTYTHDDLDAAEAKVLKASGQEPSAVDQAVEKSMQWRVAFDADPKPSVNHVIRFAKEPVVDVRIRQLLPEERDKVNTAALRNLVVNYDDLKSQAQQATDPNATTPTTDSGFRPLVEDEIHRANGLRGIRLVFEVRASDGRLYTLDQTALIDSNPSRLYLLVIQAGEREYLAHSKLLDDIATSFTIKKKD